MNRRAFLKSAPFIAAVPFAEVEEAVEGIEPPFFVRMPNDITEAELEANRKWIAEQYKNVEARPLIIQGDVEIIPNKRGA